MTRAFDDNVSLGATLAQAWIARESQVPQDVLVLAEWDRVTRSMMDGIRIIERVAARGAMLKALDRQWLDLTTPIGKGILAFLSALAEDERTRILARANGGRTAAKKSALVTCGAEVSC